MIKIGVWSVDPQTCSLTRGQEQIKVPPRAMDVLCFLARRAGQVVSAETLLNEFWPSTSASDHAVHKTIVTLRRALGDSSQNPSYLKTFPKRGYALIAEVVELSGGPSGIERAGPTLTELPISHSGNPVQGIQPTRVNRVIVAASSLFLAGLALLLFWVTEPADAPPVADTTTIIEITPITVTGGTTNSEYSYLAHGIRTAVTVNLAKLPNVRVLNRSGSNNDYSVNEKSDTELAPDHILNADLIARDDNVKVTVRLMNASSNEIEYSDQLETTTGNMLSMQNWIVDNVANALRIVIDKSQLQAMHDWGTGDARAYDHFLKAEFYREQWNQNDWQMAITHYQRAISIDPRFVNAYTGLATVANYLSVYSGHDQTQQLLAMLAEYQRQLALMLPNSPAVELLKSMSLNVEGMHHVVLEKRYREQILSGTAPAYVFAQYGLLLQGARLYDEAMKYLNLASSDDPYRTDPNEQSNFLTGVLTPWKAIEVKTEQLVDQPRHIGMIGTLVSSLAITGDFDTARYYLARQQDADTDGIRVHLSKIRLSAMTGDLTRQQYLQSPDNSRAAKFDVEFPELFNTENQTEPDLLLNYGIMALISADIPGARQYWQQIPAVDTRRLVTRLHASEIFFPTTVLESQEYADLLQEMGVGQTWQHKLMQGVISMQEVTGIRLHTISRASLERGQYMPRNNLWSDQDWAKLELLRSSVASVESTPAVSFPP
jgi:DNA-binding winged helix-turn-helix (wHTH) protein/TolB-like protein/Tfp pilus assembly protein PilF